MGENIKDFDNEQIKNGNGYDHNFVLDTKGDINTPAVELYSPASGILLEMFTDEPGVQVYSGNFLDGTATGKKGITYNQHAAICLESQHYPQQAAVAFSAPQPRGDLQFSLHLQILREITGTNQSTQYKPKT